MYYNTNNKCWKRDCDICDLLKLFCKCLNEKKQCCKEEDDDNYGGYKGCKKPCWYTGSYMAKSTYKRCDNYDNGQDDYGDDY